jgi:hypothetical protein
MIARTLAEVEALSSEWQRVEWRGEQAEYPYYVAAARLEQRQPFAVLLGGSAAAGRIETRRLDTRIGYLRVYAPRVRVLQIVPGGLAGNDVGGLREVVAALLRDGEVDAVSLPALPIESAAYREFAELGGPLERQRFVPVWERRLLDLPATFDEFLAGRSRKTRFGVRYDGKRLEEELGDSLSVAVHRDAEALSTLTAELERVARTSYQRAVGGGFVDTPAQRELLGIALDHGWARAYVLSARGGPIAYWLCSVHGGTITLRGTAYVPEHAKLRPGIYLLMRLIEDACADPSLATLDFGPGRSSYKRHFSNRGYAEQNLLVFAPRLRPRAVNMTRSSLLGVGAGLRRGLDAVGGTERLRTEWRRRLRR